MANEELFVYMRKWIENKQKRLQEKEEKPKPALQENPATKTAGGKLEGKPKGKPKRME